MLGGIKMNIFESAVQAFEDMYANVTVPIVLLGPSGSIRRVNSAFLRLSGYSPERIESAQISAYVNGPDDRPLDGLQSLTGRGPFSLRMHDGSLVATTLLWVPFHDEKGSACGGLLFCSTGSWEPGAKLPDMPFEMMAETPDFLLKIIEASYDGIVIADMNDRCLHVNSALERITGYDRDFFIGRRFSDYIEVENWADEISEEKVARVNETGRIAYEAVFRCRDGRLVYLEHGVSLVQNNEGTCIASLKIVRDITEKKMAEQALRQAYEYRNRFFANVTHAFRTPLTLCIGPLENLMHGDFGALESPVAEQLKTVLNSSRLLLLMVDHLLEFNRLQSGTIAIARTQVQLHLMCAALIDSFQETCIKKNISLDCHVPENLPTLYTDPVHMRSILQDLTACVFTFVSSGSSINIAAEHMPPDEAECEDATPGKKSQAGCIQLSIQTTGSTLSAEQRRRLIDCFEVPETGPDTLNFTIGIRLMHARGLAGSLGLDLSVVNTVQAKTLFLLTLPLVRDVDQREDEAICVDDASSAPVPLEPEMPNLEPGEETACISGKRPLIMIVEDNRVLRNYISTIVQRNFDAVAVRDGLEALDKMQHCTPDLILSDIMMSGMDGYELLRTVKANDQLRTIPFVFLTARADVEMKIAGLEEGADDYMVKPFNAQELMARIKSLLRLRALMMKSAQQARQISTMTTRLQEKYRYGSIVGKSAPMRKIYHLLESIRNTESTVLVTGETGTGKELVANAIHYSSRRSAGPLISVNCGAIPRELMEREFFGHVKGAYTGAVENRRGYFSEASGGTLFLDEIGEMDRDMQVKLLRVLERGEIVRVGDPISRKVDVRLIAATNKDLRVEIKEGRFREDLYYRLFVIPIHVPSLRERREDIPLLIDHFCEKLKIKMDVDIPSIPEKEYQYLVQHDYPGNVRELENLIERFCLLGGVLSEAPTGVGRPELSAESSGSAAFGDDDIFEHPEPLKRAQQKAAHDLIMRTLNQCGNNHAVAARKLGIARSSLYRKLNEFDSGT